jgi:hypothetical protein
LLRTYLQALLNTQKRGGTKESERNQYLEAVVLSEVCSLYGPDLKDPISQGPKLTNTLHKVIEKYLSTLDTSKEATEAVSKGILHTVNQCIVPKFGPSVKKIDGVVLDKLDRVISSGTDMA